MRRSVFLAFAALLAVPLAAQNARESVRLNLALPSNAGQLSAAADADLCAVCWSDGTTDEVFVSVSDGRALGWSTPIRVDADTSAKTTQLDSVHVAGTDVYVVWEAAGGLFLASSHDGGTTFSVPVSLDVGPGSIRDWRVDVSDGVSGDHLYVACSTAVVNEVLYLAASHDGGTLFQPTVTVSSAPASGDVDALAVAADGNTVHLAWDDDRSGSDSVYYQRSIDGGVSFLALDVALGDSPGTEDSNGPLEMSVSGATLAVLWNEEPSGSGNEVIEVNTSLDGGQSFGGAVTVGNYTPLTNDTDEGDVAIDALTGNVIACWEDNRSGSDEVYVATSTDGGLTFGPDVVLSSGGAEKPRLAAGNGGVAVSFESGNFPRTVESAYSNDGGGSWSTLEVSDNGPDTVDFVALAHDRAYGNFVHAWVSLNGSDFNVYAGGYRPQSLSATGFDVAGTASFALSQFQSGTPRFAWVLGSNSEGSLPLPFGDGRDLGLTLDGTFLVTLNDPGTFLTTLDVGGIGTTASFLQPLPLGTTVFAAAISFDLAPITLRDLTDIVRVTVQ